MTEPDKMLAIVLAYIAEQFSDDILAQGINHVVHDIGTVAAVLGIKESAQSYHGIKIMVPLKKAPEKSLVEIVHGADFSGHRQTSTGLVIPQWIAEQSGLDHQIYMPNRYMILHL